MNLPPPFLLPRVMQRKQSLGKPDQKDLNENLAATQGLAHMIAECKKLFQVRHREIGVWLRITSEPGHRCHVVHILPQLEIIYMAQECLYFLL